MRDDNLNCSIKPIINHKHKCIYIHIPKNASSTIRDCIWGQQKDLDYIKYKEVNKYHDYFKFTFVRNPYDRFLSFYLDNVRGEMLKAEEHRSYRDYNKYKKSVNGLINHIFEYDNNRLDYHLKPQIWFTENIELDFIGKVETFNTDFRMVKVILNIDKEHRHLRETEKKYGLLSAQKNMIYKKYEDDFKRFGYSKE